MQTDLGMKPAPEQDMTHTPKATSDGPRHICETMAELTARVLSRPCNDAPVGPSPAQQRDLTARRRWSDLIKAIGVRYEPCRLENFQLAAGDGHQRQEAAMAILKSVSENVSDHVKSGGNLILYGPPGTGKDHLLVSLMRVAVLADHAVEWVNGQDLYGTFRDWIEADANEGRSLTQFARPAVLAISDPVPPKGEASGYATTMLYRIIDRRYRELKGTWVTVNVMDATEATRELTGPIFDRLRDNCVTVFCNWPSFRQTRRPPWLPKAK